MAQSQRNRSSRPASGNLGGGSNAAVDSTHTPGNPLAGAATPAAPQFLVESLERRTFLSSSALMASAATRFVPTSASVSDAKNGPLAPAGSALASLYVNYRKAQSAGTLGAWTTPLSEVIEVRTPANKPKTVAVTIRATGNLNSFANRMRALGMQVASGNTKYGVIGGFLPIARLRDAVADKSTLAVSPIYTTQLSAQGSADNAADEGQNTDDVRTNFGLTGEDVTVGVISNSADQFGNGLQGSIGSGDLPPDVQILQDGDPTASDEGRAMMELIYDIVPDADLKFATGAFGQLNFANNIRRLAAAGADVIVDDVAYLDEPFFQPGVIDQAIAEVRAKNVPYLSSVGNFADGGFEQDADFEVSGNRTFIDFDPGVGVSTQMRITLTDFSPVVLQWDNPFNGVVGDASADLVLRLYTLDINGRKVLAHVQDDNNLANGRPIETLFPLPLSEFGTAGVAPGTYFIEIESRRLEAGATLPTRYKFITRGALGTTQFAGTRAGAFGHNAGEDTISVGAVFFNDAPPFGGGSISELTSSLGPVTLLFDAEGNRLSSPLLLQKPDVSGVDGTNTSFFSFGNDSGGDFGNDIPQDDDQFPNFFGTSAAAANVSAAVAQLLQADPTLSPDEVEDLLESTAVPLNGAAEDEYDEQGGFGLIDALEAVNLVIQPAVGDVIDVVDGGTARISNIFIKFNQLITGFTKNDVTLTRDGGPNLINSNVSLTSPDGITFRLNHLESVTDEPGTYTLTIDGAAGGLTSGAGASFTDVLTETFTILPAPELPTRVVNVRADAINSGSIRVRFSDYQAEEDNFLIERSTDAQFSSGYRRFTVGANSTQFVDTGLTPGRRYYYRVSARNETGVGPASAAASAITLARGEIVLDNSFSTTRVTSGFRRRTDVAGMLGGDYLNDSGSVKGGQSVTFNPVIDAADEYFVYARWPKLSGNSTRVPFTIRHDDGDGITSSVVYVNQRTTGGNWVLLGKFQFAEGAGQSITVSNGGTSGDVVVDSVRLLPSKVDVAF